MISLITLFSSILISTIISLLAIAFYTLIERKILGYFHLRKGPNKVGLVGLPQPFSDAIKLFLKEKNTPTSSNKLPFILAPSITLALAIMIWSIYPHRHQSFFIKFRVLYFLCVSRINVYTTFIAGWRSNSKYALLGALRRVAQTISYEVSISLIILTTLIIIITMDFTQIKLNTWTTLIIAPLSVMWFITVLAETNRAPFDFSEGESEIISGFNIEYRGGLFAIIFMAEYINILIISLLSRILFLRITTTIISDLLVIIKTITLVTLFVWIRASYPRIRYDHLINLTWKIFLPGALAALVFILATTNTI